MVLCFYKVRSICIEKNCHIEYGYKGNCPRGLDYKEDVILNVNPNRIENILIMKMKN